MLHEALLGDLNTFIKEDPVLRQDSVTVELCPIIRWDENASCAIANFTTTLVVDQVVERLSKASKGRPYCFDKEFHGITPLYEGERTNIE